MPTPLRPRCGRAGSECLPRGGAAADRAAGADLLGRRSLGNLARFGEEQLQVDLGAGGVQPPVPSPSARSTGKFRFNLVATNGQVIATSEAYESKASAIKGIESVKRNAPTAEIDDQTDK
jgi:uncharacterized protein YegP (UPF0339 family)